MKKVILFILFCFILYGYNCNALTKEQQDNIATYAIEMIEKGNARKASDGTTLLKYESGTDRLYAFRDELHKGHFSFNCDSFVSYVLYHTYGLKVMKNGNEPYTVTNYEQAPRRSNSGMYEVARGRYESIVSKLEKADIIVCFTGDNSTHVFFYVGDGLIAQARQAGLVVQTFESYYKHYSSYMIVRIKDDAPTKTVDMSIYWPDTKETEILGKDDYPTIKVDYDKSKYYKEYNMIINLEDDKKIDSYSISYGYKNINWITVEKEKTSVEYLINKNGIYYISVRDSKGQVKTAEVTIRNIDNTSPEINNIEYSYNGNNTYDITINAIDDTKLKYSLDGVNYQGSNIFKNILLNNYQLKVIDEASNEKSYQINLSSNAPLFKANYDEEKESIVLNFINNTKIVKYAISETFEKNINWLNYNNETSYHVDSPGTYYIWLLNSDGIPYYVVIDDTCDARTISYTYSFVNEKDNYSIKIDNNSKCPLLYSKDGSNYQKSNVINNLDYGENTIYIQDASGNVYFLSVDHIKESIDIVNIVLIIAIITVLIIVILCYRNYKIKNSHK